MKHVTVLQHTQSEWLGAIEDHLEGRGIRFGYARPFAAGGQVPGLATLGDGLILLGGGPFGAATPGLLLATLDEEVRLVRACLMTDKPVLGFGLGAQVLALAADGGAERAPYALTVGAVQRAADEALGGLMPGCWPLVACARDRALPPAYARVLARDTGGHPAAWQIGTHTFGFAGHIGIRRAMVEDLVMEFDEAPEDAVDGLAAIAALGSGIEDSLVPLMAGLVAATGWGEA